MAYYTGSEAVWLDGSAARQYQERPQRSFEVIEGAGLDARARQGVSSSFVNAVKVAVLCIAVLIGLAFARVFISSATVSILKQNATARTQINEARSARAELEVQRSVLGASSRIDLIATQNLGMVLAAGTEQIDVSDYFPEPVEVAEGEVEGALEGEIAEEADLAQEELEGSAAVDSQSQLEGSSAVSEQSSAAIDAADTMAEGTSAPSTRSLDTISDDYDPSALFGSSASAEPAE